MLWFFYQNIESNKKLFSIFYVWSKIHGFILNLQFLNFCYFLLTSYYSQCFDFKSELSELYKTEHFLKNHKTTSVRVFQWYDSTWSPQSLEEKPNIFDNLTHL